MKVTTSDQMIAAIKRVKAERGAAERANQKDDVAVLDEELEELRLTLLKLRWKETSNAMA